MIPDGRSNVANTITPETRAASRTVPTRHGVTLTGDGMMSLLLDSQRFQVLHQVELLLVLQAKLEARVVAADDVEQRGEAPIVVEAALVFRLHEQASLAHEDARQIHGLVGASRGSVGLEAVDLQLRRRVLIPAGFGPQRLVMAAIAVRLATEQGVSALRGVGVEVDAGSRLHGRQGQLIE